MSDRKCIKGQLSNLRCKAVCNFKACLLGPGGEQMEFMVCMPYCCNSRELSPSLSTWEQPLALLRSCQKVFCAASSRTSTHAPGPGRAILPVTLLSGAGRIMHRTTLLVGWPWKMVVVNIVSAGHWGRRAACETSESGSLDSCECVVAPECISSVKRSVQMDSQSLIGTEQQLRSLKALTSCHIQAQIPIFTVQQDRGAVGSIHRLYHSHSAMFKYILL